MQAIIVAVLALIGSSATAAWITDAWQRRKYQADTLQDGFKRLVEARAEFTRSVSTCVSLLSIAHALGKIWKYQQVKFQDNLESARSSAITLDAAQILSAAVHAWSAGIGGQLSDAAQATLDELGLVTFSPVEGDAERNGVTVQLSRGNTPEVAGRLVAHLNDIARLTGELTTRTAEHHGRLMGSRCGRLWLFFALAASIVLSLLYFWHVGAWAYDVRDDRVVWLNSVTGEVRVVSLPAPPSIRPTVGGIGERKGTGSSLSQDGK